MSCDIVFSYAHGNEFAQKFVDISDIGKQVGFRIPLKISHRVKAHVNDLGLELANVVGFDYKVYPDDVTFVSIDDVTFVSIDDVTFVSIRVPEVTGKKVWVMTCLEQKNNNIDTVVICMFFPSEYVN